MTFRHLSFFIAQKATIQPIHTTSPNVAKPKIPKPKAQSTTRITKPKEQKQSIKNQNFNQDATSDN